MRTIIRNNKVGFQERGNMKPDDYAIQQWLDKFDRHLVEIEAKWGVNRLPSLVSQATAEKWQRQMDKLNAAIIASDLYTIPDLVNGAIKGCGVMEGEATALGYRPNENPERWTVKTPSGKTLAVVKSNADASILQGQCAPDTVIWTLDELANIIEAKFTLVNEVKATFKGAELKPFDFIKGDSVSI